MLATNNIEFYFYLHTTLLPTSYIVSSEQARCSRRWQNTDFDKQKLLTMRKGVSASMQFQRRPDTKTNGQLVFFVQEVAKPSKERYPPNTLYHIVCGLCRFMEENNEKLDFNPLEASDKRCNFVAVCSTCYYYLF